MKLTVRLKYGVKTRSAMALNRNAALVASSLMTPVALMAWALGGWRLAADLQWTGPFAIRAGLFSHWQVWIALGLVFQLAAFLLHRISRNHEYDGDGAIL